MGAREMAMAMLDGFVSFGKVVRSKQADATKQVLASIRGNEGPSNEERPYQPLWGHAAIVFNPPADTEVIFVRLGEEMVPIASRDVRFGITVAEGEVVLRNLSSSSPCRIRMKADGEVVVESGALRVVAPGDVAAIASKALAIASAVDARVTSLQTAHDTHKHATAAAGPPSLPDVFANGTPGAPFASVASARIFTKD